MSAAYATDGRHATRCRQLARRAVAAGRAEYLPPADILAGRKALQAHLATRSVEVRQPAAPPRKIERTRFGQGLVFTNPVYRAPVSLDDMAWWEAENARQEELELGRRFAEYQAQERLSSGWDC